MNQREINEKVSEGYIHFRCIVEILGKPTDHVKKSVKDFIAKIEDDKKYLLAAQEIAEPKKVEDSELYSSFAELEVLTKDSSKLVEFCFDYMPSSVEVIDPEQVVYQANDFTDFLNDLQARLHAVNMGMQDFKQQNKNLVKNTSIILRNFVVYALEGGKTINELNKMTGINEYPLHQILSALAKEGKVEKKGEKYFLK